MTRKGQVTIPKLVREALWLKPFDPIEIEMDGSEARLRRASPSLEEIAGALPLLNVPIEEMPAIAKQQRARRLSL